MARECGWVVRSPMTRNQRFGCTTMRIGMSTRSVGRGLLVVIAAMVVGCGGEDGGKKLRVINQATTPVAGLRIDGIDMEIELAPGAFELVPVTEPGRHTYSVRPAPAAEDPDAGWSPPREFEVPETGGRQLVIRENDLRPAPTWNTHRFEKWRYSVELPGEPSVKLEGGSVIAGTQEVSCTVVCEPTKRTTFDDLAQGESRAFEHDGFPAFTRRWSDRGRTTRDLYVLANGNLYHLIALIGDEAGDGALAADRFLGSLEIDPAAD